MRFIRQLLSIVGLITALGLSIGLIVYTGKTLPRRSVTQYVPESAVFVLEMTKNGIEKLRAPDPSSTETQELIDALQYIWTSVTKSVPVSIEALSLIISNEDGVLFPSFVIKPFVQMNKKDRENIVELTKATIPFLTDSFQTELMDNRAIIFRSKKSHAYEHLRKSPLLQGHSGVAVFMDNANNELLEAFFSQSTFNTAKFFPKTAGKISMYLEQKLDILRILYDFDEGGAYPGPMYRLSVPTAYDFALSGHNLDVMRSTSGFIAVELEALAMKIANDFHVPVSELTGTLPDSGALIRSGDSWIVISSDIRAGLNFERLLASSYGSTVRIRSMPDGSDYREIIRSIPESENVLLANYPVKTWRSGQQSLFSADKDGFRLLSNDRGLMIRQLSHRSSELLGERPDVDRCLGNDAAGGVIDLIVSIPKSGSFTNISGFTLVKVYFSDDDIQIFQCIDE